MQYMEKNNRYAELRRAVLDQDIQQVKKLIQSGVDVRNAYTTDKDGVRLPILYDALSLIPALKKGDSFDDAIFNLAYYAVEDHGGYETDYQIIKLLIDNGADVNGAVRRGESRIPLLYEAVVKENERLVEMFVSAGASWNTELVFSRNNKYILRKYPFDLFTTDSSYYLEFLRKKGWKGKGLFGWQREPLFF